MLITAHVHKCRLFLHENLSLPFHRAELVALSFIFPESIYAIFRARAISYQVYAE